jgi:hypothetical protein
VNKKNTDKPIFFVDRALGKNLVKILRNAGANAEAHIDHFAPNSPDVEWLPEVSRRGWIVLTKDANLGRTPSEQIFRAIACLKYPLPSSRNNRG